MATPRLDHDRAARVLIDASLFGDEKAAVEHGITARTIRRWRERMEEDDELSGAVHHRLKLIVRNKDELWLKQVPSALEKLLNHIELIVDNHDPSWGDLGETMKAVDVLADIALVRRAFDAKFGQAGTPDTPGGETGEIVPHPAVARGQT